MPFNEDEHNVHVRQLWTRAYPSEPVPDIPAEQWKRLGFQGTNPATDFRGSGLCGIDCLLAIVEHSEFFHALMKSADAHEIPFATAGINIVSMIFELMGWGFKSPGIPTGNSPTTYRTLCKLLFEKDDDTPVDKQVPVAKSVFYKIYFLIFALMEKTWTFMKASYMDFPTVKDNTMEKIEEVLKKIENRFVLDSYLREELHLSMTFCAGCLLF